MLRKVRRRLERDYQSKRRGLYQLIHMRQCAVEQVHVLSKLLQSMLYLLRNSGTHLVSVAEHASNPPYHSTCRLCLTDSAQPGIWTE